MEQRQAAQAIREGNTVLGIELGSTRIKAALIGPDYTPVASGEYLWENRYENGVWTYRMEDVWNGLQEAYRALRLDVERRYGQKLSRIAALGVSGMMHGYLPLNRRGEPLTPFRTWRNTITGPASEILSERFQFNIPQRWSVAHLYCLGE
ncbi:MAG: hypothetical protein IJK52_06825 [Oscillospiraceae bacterium]|nr:hypothetical protein [Oscillospiraceae bacterium]